MKFKSEHITQASGSIGGVTYARAKGGTLYRRARAIPVNPNTANQAQVRNALSNMVTTWTEILTQAQRDPWNLYGQNVLFTDKLGSPGPRSGQNVFISFNTPRLQADSKLATALTAVLTAPAIFDRGDFTTPSTPTLDAVTGFSMAFEAADQWAGENGSAMLIFQGRPRNASREFFKGPYRLIGSILGIDPGPAVSPKTITAANVTLLGYPLVAGQVNDIVVAVTFADGRLTTRRTVASVEVTP